MNRLKPAVALATFVLLASGTSWATDPPGPDEDLVEWRLSGQSRLTFENYDVNGPADGGLYRSTGNQGYGELSVRFERKVNRFQSWRGFLLGLYNESDYRNNHDGFVAERMGLVLQSGLTRLPYRLEIGDSFAYLSHRTLFRGLKGAKLEVQSGPATRAHWSLVVLSGATVPEWHGLSLADQLTTAASWLVEHPRIGRLSLNAVDFAQDDDSEGDWPQRESRIFGLSAASNLRLGSEMVALEGELNHMDLVRGVTNHPGGNDAFYFQATGRGRSPFDYRLRFEDYGVDYRPTAVPVVPDRRSYEGHIGYRLTPSVHLRARYQTYRDFRSSNDPADTDTAGLSLYGPFLPWGLSGNLDAIVQDLGNRSDSLDSRTSTLSLDLYRPRQGWVPRLRLFLQDQDDRALDAQLTTGQIFVGADRTFSRGRWSGNLTPGLVLRRISDGPAASDDWQPSLGLTLARGPHLLQQNLGWLNQDRQEGAFVDLDTLDYRLLYRLGSRRDALQVEFDSQWRDPAPGSRTRSLRTSVSWTHQFDTGVVVTSGLAGLPGAGLPRAADAFVLAQLSPDLDLGEAFGRLKRAGLGRSGRIGNLLVYESRIFTDVDARQRLFLSERAGAVARSAVVVDMSGITNDDDAARLYDRVRFNLVTMLGNPSAVYEQGDFAADFRAQVNRGSLIRLLEWVEPGGVIRLGLPRRLDGQVRIEVHYASEFPSVRETLWGMEEAR